MTAEWVSAVSEAIGALFTVALFVLGVLGLRSWSDRVRADHEINLREWAREMLTAVGDLSKHVAALRLGRVSPTELLEGSARLEAAGIYSATPPAQSIEALDRLMQKLWHVYHRGLTYAESDAELAGKLSEIKKFTSVVSAFRTAFCQKNFGRVPYIHTKEGVELDSDAERDLLKMELIIQCPDSGEDPFGARLEAAAGALVQRYSRLATRKVRD